MTAALARPTEQATKRAAVYLRQSLDPTGQQFGVDRQREEIMRYIEGRGWNSGGRFPARSIPTSRARFG
jgi:site-specific DNA recombinase